MKNGVKWIKWREDENPRPTGVTDGEKRRLVSPSTRGHPATVRPDLLVTPGIVHWFAPSLSNR
ncbi:hypothetical protein PFISCL1PPCAC_5880 [Pristionchus fissidentatus]|uniref:Uncharacterized protein n=1 Tax=Pristionchus fissidentatus TaxID=1538716 RepID=A0AAV5V9K6_9BILA|nr:hypothetical protein PFISCL1PPCAC_5877 [Pristionchus fissidentatus]GMT14583.1 hypothetical protein PFISCL1PPCAC_5880 [Pristionchus fissidentatus]